jgi:hypothetical protein
MPATIVVKFPGVSAREASIRANSLADLIESSAPETHLQHLSERRDTQDAGTILEIILGAASIKLLAAGIRSWLERNSGCAISLTADGISITHLDSSNAPDVLNALTRLTAVESRKPFAD